jgi:hypothetical protein
MEVPFLNLDPGVSMPGGKPAGISVSPCPIPTAPTTEIDVGIGEGPTGSIFVSGGLIGGFGNTKGAGL